MISEQAMLILHDVLNEIDRAESKFPEFPTDPVHAAAVVAEEAGELVQACLELTYEKGLYCDVKAEAIQVAAMAFRFLHKFGNLQTRPSEQK